MIPSKENTKDRKVKYLEKEQIDKLIDIARYELVYKKDGVKYIKEIGKQVIIERKGIERDKFVLLIRVLFTSGLRISEALQIKFNNVQEIKIKNKIQHRILLIDISKGKIS